MKPAEAVELARVLRMALELAAAAVELDHDSEEVALLALRVALAGIRALDSALAVASK